MVRQHKQSTTHSRLKMARLHRNLQPSQYGNDLFAYLKEFSNIAPYSFTVAIFAVLLCLKVLDSSASSLFPLSFPTSFRFFFFFFRRPGRLVSSMCNACPYSFYMLFSILPKTDCITPISSLITL